MVPFLTLVSIFLFPFEVNFKAPPKCETYNPRLADEGCPKGGGGGITLNKDRIEFKTTKDGRTGFVRGESPINPGPCGGGGGNCGVGKGKGGGNGTGNEGRGKGPIK